MSKQGRKEPRRILYMVALTAIRCNPLIREIYQQLLQRGMSKKAAIGVCMHKILRIIYGMLKNNTPFNPEIDRQNRDKPQPVSSVKHPQRQRRLQPYDQNAPISRRQNRKRKQQELSHRENNTTSGTTPPIHYLDQSNADEEQDANNNGNLRHRKAANSTP